MTRHRSNLTPFLNDPDCLLAASIENYGLGTETCAATLWPSVDTRA